MDYTEALNLMMNFNSGIRRKNWEKGKYIAYSDGREIPTIPTGDGAHSKWGDTVLRMVNFIQHWMNYYLQKV